MANSERITAGDIVKVVAQGLGVGQFGNVVDITGSMIEVNFPDGVAYPDGTLVDGNLMFTEAELDKVSV